MDGNIEDIANKEFRLHAHFSIKLILQFSCLKFAFDQLLSLSYFENNPFPSRTLRTYCVHAKLLRDNWNTLLQRNLVPKVSHLTAPWSEREETLSQAGHLSPRQLKTSRKGSSGIRQIGRVELYRI